MDVHIEEMTSTVRATDSQSLLSPQVLEQIVRVVLARVREADSHRERVDDEKQLRPRVSAQEKANWE